MGWFSKTPIEELSLQAQAEYYANATSRWTLEEVREEIADRNMSSYEAMQLETMYLAQLAAAENIK